MFPITASGLKAAWARAMNKYEGEGVAENDLRAKVASDVMDWDLMQPLCWGIQAMQLPADITSEEQEKCPL
ncbi:hypothetical protein CARN8_2360002 [mine drainage metagenome]|uniref:Uncharacterized protein n=1 Tax=mine drainage metagenome TaxID=410659 RepID=A0A3P3ZMX8_9ZZZZ